MNKKGKIIFIILAILVSILILICAWNFFQASMFFHPWHDYDSYKKLQELDEFKEIKIKNDTVDLSGWFWDIQKKDKAPLVIYFTGNAQNSSNNMYNYYLSGNIKEVFGDYNLMIVDYPGYGISKGKPSDVSMFTASEYVFDYAIQMSEVDKDNIVIMGYSIGTGVATYCASVKDAKGLILIAPYDNALSLYNDAINIFHGPLKGLARYKFDSKTYAESVKEPTLIITSKKDQMINYNHSLDLSKHFSNLKDVIVLEGISHENYIKEPKTLELITEFLKFDI